MNKKIRALKIPISILKEGNKFVAYSPALDLSTSSNSFEGVKKRFEEAVEIFFNEIMEMGTFEEVLLDLGWKKKNKELTPPVIISQGLETIHVSNHRRYL